MDNKIIAIIVAAIVVVAGVGVYFVFDNDENSNIDLLGNKSYLEIFGNANGDHLLNDADVNVIQDYIDGKIIKSNLIQVEEGNNKNKHYLADANLDGVVDSKDITYLKSIMDRSGKTMNFIDSFGNLIKAPLKIDGIACDYFASAELLQMVGVQDKIVAATKALLVLEDYYLQGVTDKSKIVNYYSRPTPDYEAVAEVDPDVWIVDANWVEEFTPNTEAIVIGLDMLNFNLDDPYLGTPIVAALTAGYLFNNVDAGIKYVEWYLETWEMMDSKSSTLSEEERPRVFHVSFQNYLTDNSDKKMRVFTSGMSPWQSVVLAGGYNIIDDHPTINDEFSHKTGTSTVHLDLEWIAEQEYDYLFAYCNKYTGSGTPDSLVPDHGYTCDDTTEYEAGQKYLGTLDVLNCESDNMYVTPGDYPNNASGGLLQAILIASVINPDLYPDLDLKAEHQKYIDVMGFDYDLDKHGVFLLEN